MIPALPTDTLPYTSAGEAFQRYERRKLACQHQGVEWSTVETLFLGMTIMLGVNPTPEYGYERIQTNKRVCAHLLEHVWGSSNEEYQRLWNWTVDINHDSSPQGVAAYLADFYLDWLYTRDGARGVKG